MRLLEHQPRLSRSKLITYIGYLLGGCILMIPVLSRKMAPGRSQTIFSLATALLIVSAVELFPEISAWVAQYSTRGQFKRCFGAAAFAKPVQLVHIFRALDEKGALHPSPDMKGPEEKRDLGVYSWLAFQDVRAGIYVANTIFQITGKEVAVVQTKDIENGELNGCAISFGLGESSFTKHLGRRPDPTLFEVKWQKSRDGQNSEACFSFDSNITNHPDNEKNLAVVARIVPAPDEEHEGCVWFVCGGRSAAGTAAAGFYLAKKWPEILKLYKESGKDLNKHSMALVIEHKLDSLRDHHDGSARVFQVGGKPLVQWSPRPAATPR